MQEEKGTISIHTENIFPVIKKFLYSDNEIFFGSWYPTPLMPRKN